MMQRSHFLAGAFGGDGGQAFAQVSPTSAAIAAQPLAVPQ